MSHTSAPSAVLSTALVRQPGENLVRGITSAGLGPPDYLRALRQHDAYCRALEECGVQVTILEPAPDHPDGCFVEDTAIVHEAGAVIARPGDPARRGEESAVAHVLSGYRTLDYVQSPGRLDGGDVMRVADHFYIGRSSRTNAEGARQLAEALAKCGFTSSELPVGAGLHLKTGITYLGRDRFIATDCFAELFPAATVVRIHEGESYAANCLAVNGRILMPAGFPEARHALTALADDVVELEMSEFQKLDGGLTCLSLLF